MERSVDILMDDLKNSLFGVMNNSGLPLSIIALILKDVNEGVQVQAKNALEKSRQQYYQSLQTQIQDEQSEEAIVND